jgi:hypothetical protein
MLELAERFPIMDRVFGTAEACRLLTFVLRNWKTIASVQKVEENIILKPMIG